MKHAAAWFLFLSMTLFGCGSTAFDEIRSEKPVVVFNTNYGDIYIELFPDQAPVATANFLEYVTDGYYSNTIFHRVIDGVLIQGGGYTPDLKKKQTMNAIINEARNGLRNDRGMVAFARGPEVNSATSQFFINLADNTFLNHKDGTPEGFGYAVFGRVIKGLNVADQIGAVTTGYRNEMNDVPVDPVIIETARLVRMTIN